MVPRIVAHTVATTPMSRLLSNASHTSALSQTFAHLSRVKPRQTMFDFTELLKENTKVYAIGMSRNTSAMIVYVGSSHEPSPYRCRLPGRRGSVVSALAKTRP